MRRRDILLGTVLLASANFGVAYADAPGKHPYYLRALSDLRGARWLLEHRSGDAAVSEHESRALEQIDAAVNDIKHAAIDDGKDLHDHAPMDATNQHAGRLRQVQDLLRKVIGDLNREEDDPASRGLNHRALEHVEEALRQTDRALNDVEHGH
jgi:hypothetical protein